MPSELIPPPHLTPLLPLIYTKLRQLNCISELAELRFKEQITLVTIDKKPVMCLSDLVHSIQANRFSREDPSPHPFNKMHSQYYCLVDKAWLCLNAAESALGNPS